MAPYAVGCDDGNLRAQRDGTTAGGAIGARMRIEPEEGRRVQGFENPWQHGGAVALMHAHVLRAAEPDASEARQRGLELDRLDALEIPPQRPGGLAHVRAGLDEDAQPVLPRSLAEQLPLRRVAMTVS